MKGIIIICLGVLLICACGAGYHFWQIDGFGCAVVALFVGGGLVSAGVNRVDRGDQFISPTSSDDYKY